MLIFSLPERYLLGMAVWIVVLVAALIWLLKARIRFKSQVRPRKWIHAGLGLWFAAVGLTVPELGCALLVDRTDSFNSTNISDLWFKRHVRLNDQGFRDSQPFTRSVPDGTRRIVFLGDSFTFGHGVANVADRFSDRVGAELERQAPHQFVVANLSAPGLGVHDMPKVWDEKVVRTDSQVDLLVYVICLNDIERLNARQTDAEYEALAKLKPQWFLFRDTYFYNWIYYRLQLWRQPRLRSYYEFVHDYYNSPAWLSMEAELQQLKEAAGSRQTELRLVIFPFLHNLGPAYPFRDVHQKIVAFARKQDIPILDLEPVLSPHAAEVLTVNPFDAHPNVRAHQLAADAILQQLLPDLIQPLDEKTRKL